MIKSELSLSHCTSQFCIPLIRSSLPLSPSLARHNKRSIHTSSIRTPTRSSYLYHSRESPAQSSSAIANYKANPFLSAKFHPFAVGDASYPPDFSPTNRLSPDYEAPSPSLSLSLSLTLGANERQGFISFLAWVYTHIRTYVAHRADEKLVELFRGKVN